MKIHWKNKYLYWGLTAFAVVSASMLFYFLLFRMGVVFGALRKLISILMPVICGAVIAYLLIPIVNFQEKHFYKFLVQKKQVHPNKTQRKVVRYVSIVLALIFGWLIIYSLISMIMPSIIESIISIINDSPRYFQNIRHWIESLLKDNPEWEDAVLSYIEQYSPKLETFLNVQLLPQLKSVLQHLSTGVFGTLVFIKNLLIGLIISIYLMAGKEEFITQSKMFVYAFLSTEHANNVIKGVRFAHRTFIGFIIGKIVDSVIIGILCYVGTKIIGTPYAMLVSVVVGVTNVIPFFGPYLGAIPTAFIILMVNPMQCLYFLIFILLLQQFDGNILGPKILGNSTGLSSFMVIVAILLFGGIMGIPGMIIGVPTLAVIMAGIKTFRAYNLREKSMPLDEQVYTHMDYMNPETMRPVDFAEDEKGIDAEEKQQEERKKEKQQ